MFLTVCGRAGKSLPAALRATLQYFISQVFQACSSRKHQLKLHRYSNICKALGYSHQYAIATEAAQTSTSSAFSTSHSIHLPAMMHLDRAGLSGISETLRFTSKYGYTPTSTAESGGFIDNIEISNNVDESELHKLNFRSELNHNKYSNPTRRLTETL